MADSRSRAQGPYVGARRGRRQRRRATRTRTAVAEGWGVTRLDGLGTASLIGLLLAAIAASLAVTLVLTAGLGVSRPIAQIVVAGAWGCGISLALRSRPDRGPSPQGAAPAVDPAPQGAAPAFDPAPKRVSPGVEPAARHFAAPIPPDGSDGPFGPQTAAVERVLELGRLTGGMGPVMWYFTYHYESDFKATTDVRARAAAVAGAHGLGGAWEAANAAGYEAGYGACGCAWEDVAWATGFVAQAVAVSHLLDPVDFDALYRVWGELYGPPSAKDIEEDPPTWPPEIAYGPRCKWHCIHGALAGKRT
jgi:hypothetical protein